MAIYHQHIDYVRRSRNRSCVQAAAYIMGINAFEEWRSKPAKFENRSADVLMTKSLGPEHAFELTKDPIKLWNNLENYENHYADTHYKTPETRENFKNISRPAQTNEIALPKEPSVESMEAALDQFVDEVYVSRGLMVTYAIHNKEGNPHAHLLISMREMKENNQWSRKKCRELYSESFLNYSRKMWAKHANHYLELEGHNVRIDHRSFVDQGIDLTPSRKRGYMGDKQGKQGRIAFENEQIWLANRDKLLEDLTPLLRELNNNYATFTQKDILTAIQKRFGDETVIISQVFEKVLQSVHYAGTDMNGYARYTSLEYKQTEEQVVQMSQDLAQTKFAVPVRELKVERAFAAQPEGRRLSLEQQTAVRTLVNHQSLAVLNGLAGTGKTTTLKVVSDLYKEAGCRVIGASISALAADKLGNEAGIHSRTLESWLSRWNKYEEARQEFLKFKDTVPRSVLEKCDWYQDLKSYEKDQLTNKDVLIVDEASMVGVKDAQKLLSFVEQRGAKVLFVGDEAQLQSISAGNFFKIAHETAHQSDSFIEMKEIRRQKEEWMREASVLFAEGSVQEALREYEKRGCIEGLESEKAILKIAQEYGAAYAQALQSDKGLAAVSELLVLTATNKDCEALNTAIRQQLREKGVLSLEDAFTIRQSIKETEPKVLTPLADEKDRKRLTDKESNKVERGYAIGDQILFLENDSSHPKFRKVEIFNRYGEFQEHEFIKNNSEGIIQNVTALEEGGYQVKVALLGEKDSPERYAVFNTNQYSAFNYGYTKTGYRSQGQTKDQVWVYATKTMDAFATYVAMTRHRMKGSLVYALEQFPTFQKLLTSLSRGQMKDNVRDWTILDENQDYYDRVMLYKSLGADKAVLYKDKDFDGDKNEAYQTLAEERKNIAQEILDQWEQHKTYVLQTGLSQEMLEIAAGYKEKQLSRAEEKACERLEEYTQTALKARTLLTEMKVSTEANLKSQGIWEVLPEVQKNTEWTKQDKYQSYENLRNERDQLAAEIVRDKILHRQFIGGFAGLNYGLGVMEKQAKAYQERLEQAPRLEKIHGLIQDWQALTREDSLEQRVIQLERQFDLNAHQRGKVAAELVILYQDDSQKRKEQQQSFSSGNQALSIHWTHGELGKAKVSYLDLLREGTVYQNYQIALEKGDETALHLIAYQQARQVTNSLFGQCSQEVEKLKHIFAENKQQNPDAFENKPEPVFWHVASYQLYVQATVITNDRAFTLTQGKPFAELPELQTLAQEMQLSEKMLKGIDQYSRQGEYQFVCREFKNTEDTIVKGEKASLLIDELIENKSLFRVFEREQIKMSGLLESLHEHDVRLQKDRLDLSNHPLAKAVFSYSDQRKVVGQAFGEISQEIEQRMHQAAERGIKIPALEPWDIPDQWASYVEKRKMLDNQAAAILQCSTQERETFVDHFNLRLSVLKPQAQRHNFDQAYQQTQDISLSYQDRAKAFYQLEEAHQNRFDETLKQFIPYTVNKEDKTQERADRDYLKSVGHYNRYAFSPLRQQKENLEDFRRRQTTFEQEFSKQDPQGYQAALKVKEENRQALHQQQTQILVELKQRFNIKEEIVISPVIRPEQFNNHSNKKKERQIRQAVQDQSAQTITLPHQVNKHNYHSSQLEAKQVREKLNSRMGDLAFELLEPLHGKPSSRTATTVRYGKKGSLSVHVAGQKQGMFMNFETGEGGDALKLIQHHYGTNYKEAYKWALSWLGENQHHFELKAKQKGMDTSSAVHQRIRGEEQWTPIFPIINKEPDLYSASLRYMMKDRTEIARFAYKDADNNILGYVIRLESADGSKMTPPLTYCRNDKGLEQWRWKGFTGDDRPLYGLDQLAIKPEASVLIVEGEKTAEAAKTLFPDYAVVSWMGGSYGVSKADWSVLKEREVVIWPDHDEAGRKAAHKIQEVLTTPQNPTVAIVNVPSIFPAKWDLADALPEGVEHQELRNHIAVSKMARKYELFDQEQKLNLDVSHLAVSSPSYQSAALSIEEGIGRVESSIVPQEKDVLAYYQSLEEENKKLLVLNRTPEQQQRAETLNKEMEETAYAISNNPALMEEAHKRNLTNHIMVDKEAYLESQGEKKAIIVNDLAVKAPVTQQQTLKTEEASLVQTIVAAEPTPSPALSAVSERELVKEYLEMDKQIKAIPTAASRSEEEKERYKELFNSSLEMSYQISQSPKAMEAITVLGLEENVTLKAKNYQRIYQASPQQEQSEEVKQDHEISQKAKTEHQQTPYLPNKPTVSQQMETKDISRIDTHSRSTSHASREPQLAHNEYSENTNEVKKGFFTRMLHKLNGREQEEQVLALAQEQARQQQKAEALRQQQELEKVKQMSLNYDYSKTIDWKNVAQNNPDQFFEKYVGLYKDNKTIPFKPFEPNEELKSERNKISKYQRENLEVMSNIVLKDDKLYARAFDKGYHKIFDNFASYEAKEERRLQDNNFVKDYLAGTSDQSVDRKDVLRHFSMLEQEYKMIKRLQLEKTPNYQDRYPLVDQMIEKMSLKIASEEQTYTQAKEMGLTPTIDKCVEQVHTQIRDRQRALERSMDRGRGMSM